MHGPTDRRKDVGKVIFYAIGLALMVCCIVYGVMPFIKGDNNESIYASINN